MPENLTPNPDATAAATEQSTEQPVQTTAIAPVDAPAAEAPEVNQASQQIAALGEQVQALQQALQTLTGEFQTKSQEGQANVEAQIKQLTLKTLNLPAELEPIAQAMTVQQLSDWVASDSYKALAKKLAAVDAPPPAQHTAPPVGQPEPTGDKPGKPAPAKTFKELTPDHYKTFGSIFK